VILSKLNSPSPKTLSQALADAAVSIQAALGDLEDAADQSLRLDSPEVSMRIKLLKLTLRRCVEAVEKTKQAVPA
jgi:hypothetical protein